MKGQIRQSLSGYYDVVADDGNEYRTRARGVFRKRKQSPLVGDKVEFKLENNNEGYLLKIDPRKNELVRPPIANVDYAIVVSACTEPKFSSNLLDRQLIMLAAHKIQPLLYFSKWDLLSSSQKNEMLTITNYYQKYYSAETSNSPKPQLLHSFQHQVMVVMGQTGAGKSTFLNKLDPSLKLKTNKISKALSRGKHTTRKVKLMDVEGNLLADTPGFSSFDLLEITKENLPSYYPDFTEFCSQCKYRGCLHINEPYCAVKQAVAEGKILQSRYDNYLQFHQLIVERKPRY